MNFITLDKQSKTPLYQQLMDSFIKAIDDNVLLPESRLPSEEVLSHTFGISRSVIKLAYDELESRSLIYRTPKGGTYVSRHNRYQIVLNHVPFFLEALKETEFDWDYKLNINEIDVDQRHLKITYFIDKIPMIVSDLYISSRIDFDLKDDWSFLETETSHTTQYKSVVLSKVESQFFNQNESFAVHEFLTIFRKDKTEIAILHQWVSPFMGQFKIEVSSGN